MKILEPLWGTGWPPLEWITGEVDVVFEPNFFPPPIRRSKLVVTVHDLSFVRNPDWFPKNQAAHRTAKLMKTIQRADAIIAVSDFTADEIRSFCPQAAGKVHVVHEAPGPEFKPQPFDKISAVKKRLNIEDDFILYVGAIELRKNLIALIQAFLGLRKAGATNSKLVLAGLDGYGSEEVKKAALKGIQRGWIRFVGYLDQEDMPALYSSARLFCYLSLYEGFGLPPLEALACGTAAVVSRIPVFQEILGPHASYVDPGNLSEISDGIARCETEPLSSLEERVAWASRYSWQKASKQTLSLLSTVHENRA